MLNAERRQDASRNSNAVVIVTRDGRHLALKPLDDDCLLDGELHPSIALRLERVRELPMTGVANLHGVERIEGRAFLVWDFVAGRTVEDMIRGLDEAGCARLKRDVLLIVERMHGQGIVHGALHGRNVIVDERGGVRVTHVSPLLHSDGEADFAAVDRIFVGAGGAEMTGESDGASVVKEDGGVRYRAIMGAIFALIVGLVVAASLVWYSLSQS